MNLKLDAYKVFCEVAKHHSFSKTARALYMTQPAVSQIIMNLEQELETRLFTRTSKGAQLTNEGQLLYEYIRSALNLIEVGERKLAESRNLLTGELKIGVGDTISKYYLLPHLETFHTASPNIKLKVINRTTMELCRMLKSGEIDIAVCNFPVKDSALETQKCMDIHDVFVCGVKYKARFSSRVRFEDITAVPMIFLERKSNSRQYVEKYLLSQGVKIQPEIELGSHELLLEFAKFNFGIACVIEEFSEEYLQQGQLFIIPMEEEIPKRSIGFCFLKSVTLSPAARQFVNVTQAEG